MKFWRDFVNCQCHLPNIAYVPCAMTPHLRLPFYFYLYCHDITPTVGCVTICTHGTVCPSVPYKRCTQSHWLIDWLIDWISPSWVLLMNAKLDTLVYLWPSATTNRTVSMLQSPSSTMDTINLTWSVSDSPNEMGYFISFKRTDITTNLTPQWIFIEGPAASHTLSGLLGGTNYDITLRLVEGGSEVGLILFG